MKQQWEPPELEEMPVVILSLHQKWWQKMAAGEKVLELRKTKPQCKTPFRVLVYVTGGVGIVGEFICPEVLEIKNFEEAERKSKVPVDISEIDLKKFWGIAFQLAAVAKTLQEETDICTACPYTYTDEQCTGCGTYWNMRDLRLDFEAIQQRLIKAATEG